MLGNLTGEPLWTPEPIVAYRGWNWDGSVLVGPHTEWPTQKVDAIHHPGKTHSAPQAGCNCGVNAYKNPLPAREYPILGLIHLTGEVHEYETGYRGQHAEIIELMVYFKFNSSLSEEDLRARIDTDGPWPEEEMDRALAKRYGVPIHRGVRIRWRPENFSDTK